MLGGLAKWLRAAGYDAYYAREGTDISDRTLARKALEEGRVLLSGDGGFLERRPVRDGRLTYFRVPPGPVEAQLGSVVERFGLVRKESRCMACNGRLEAIPPSEAAGRVPPGAGREQDEFFLCQGCGKIFWHGSHWDRIGARLSRVFDRP
jgi:uncharacterized protein with PIN domain